MYCKKCGAELAENENFCHSCGAAQNEIVNADDALVSHKSRLVAVLLCWFLGLLGAHRFYVGKPGTAILMILTLGGLGIWILIDFIVILCGNFKDSEGKVVRRWLDQ